MNKVQKDLPDLGQDFAAKVLMMIARAGPQDKAVRDVDDLKTALRMIAFLGWSGYVFVPNRIVGGILWLHRGMTEFDRTERR